MARASTRLVLICGLPASGKTTLARQLAPGIPAVRLDKDQWTSALGLDVWDDEVRGRIEAQLWALAQELLAQGQSVILEWGHWARAERDEKRLGARALGVGVELHYLDAPLDELIERAERRTASGEWTAAPMTQAHFEMWATAFQPPDEDELLLFDPPASLDRQPTLTSALLVVRPLRPDDFEVLWAISSDPLLWEQHPAKERAERDGFGRWFEDAIASCGALVVISRVDGEVIGTSRYDRLDEDASEVEIGWTFITRRLWGGPHNAELKRLMLEHAFGSVGTVAFRVHSENRRSRRAVEKLGATLSATEIDPLGRGENVVYRLTAAEWAGRS